MQRLNFYGMNNFSSHLPLISAHIKMLLISKGMSLWKNPILLLPFCLLLLLHWKTQVCNSLKKPLNWCIWKRSKQYIFLHSWNFCLHFSLKQNFGKTPCKFSKHLKTLLNFPLKNYFIKSISSQLYWQWSSFFLSAWSPYSCPGK